jgi:hypothetical protein
MKKKILWHLVDQKGKRIYGQAGCFTRKEARGCLIVMKSEMLEPWNDDIEWPLHIEREEWLLVSNKVVA